MADLHVTGEADELAVALVQALALQDGDKAMGLAMALDPLIGDRPSLRARHATWMSQAHQLRGELDQATSMIRHAITLATIAGDTDALPALKALKAQLVTGKIAAANAGHLPMPETLLGRAVYAMDNGDMSEGASLARRARIEAQSIANSRDEVLSLLALARIEGQEDSAIRAAYEVADRSDDKNLVTAVSRAAHAAAVPLPKKVF
jgi:hypothetical protein